MKSCPKCNRTYSEETAFCLEDGALLSASHNADETLVLPAEEVTVISQEKEQRIQNCEPKLLI